MYGIRHSEVKRVVEFKHVYQTMVKANVSSKLQKIGLKFYGVLTRNGNRHQSLFCDTAREAALWVDKKLIDLKEEPVNILKRKAA